MFTKNDNREYSPPVRAAAPVAARPRPLPLEEEDEDGDEGEDAALGRPVASSQSSSSGTPCSRLPSKATCLEARGKQTLPWEGSGPSDAAVLVAASPLLSSSSSPSSLDDPSSLLLVENTSKGAPPPDK
mmetsp:Transcript_43974/g.111997  ORF Transcript_43974/g.111997 Transcript_43974/m.111997 type:complete len:129 (-) Transcript_43974:198-584(-)